jgi:hypothetical protein
MVSDSWTILKFRDGAKQTPIPETCHGSGCFLFKVALLSPGQADAGRNGSAQRIQMQSGGRDAHFSPAFS